MQAPRRCSGWPTEGDPGGLLHGEAVRHDRQCGSCVLPWFWGSGRHWTETVQPRPPTADGPCECKNWCGMGDLTLMGRYRGLRGCSITVVLNICVWLFMCIPFSHVQEAKLLIAQAYRHTEKLLLDNRDKLILVSHASHSKMTFFFFPENS